MLKESPNHSPMLNQYLSIKAQYPDSVLFFRIGDFYEMFFEDAVEASKILDITLTSRNKGEAEPVPLCGVPWHSCQPYIARLLSAGKKVAICEQVEDPKVAKGVVKREVIRVVTPGTILDESGLEKGKPNYLAALCGGDDLFFACLDLSTGEFRAGGVPHHEGGALASLDGLLEELAKLDPREILVPKYFPHEEALRDRFSQALLTVLEESEFNPAPMDVFHGAEEVRKIFPEALKPAGALWHYICATQKGAPPHITALTLHETARFLVLDESARANLELDALLQLIDRTGTPMGSRLLRRWLYYPLTDPGAIRQRQEAVALLMAGSPLTEVLERNLPKIYDLERLTARVAMENANARDLAALGSSLGTFPSLIAVLQGFAGILGPCAEDLSGFEPLVGQISKTLAEDPPFVLKEGGLIRPGIHPELDELRGIRGHGKDFIAALEEREKHRTGIGSLKVGFNKIFGYYIEVTHTHREKIPADYIRKQTLVNAERYITPELKAYEEKVLGAEERIRRIEYELFVELRVFAAGWVQKIQKAAATVARLDSLFALAKTAHALRWVCPEVNAGAVLAIEEGRHPLVEAFSKERFIPNDVFLDGEENRFLMITGPNMAGKSTVMRQSALIVILAQMGSFVPAGRAQIGVVDRIFTRVGASDRLSKGESTFMVEMKEAAHILKEATARSLVIIDEIGRGTSTYDGVAIAWAVAEFLHNRIKAKTLFATHYHELIDLARFCTGMKNFNIAVREWNGKLVFLRKLVPGPTSKSYGVEVARLAGLPAEVITRAKEILARWEEFAREREEGLGHQMSLFSSGAKKEAASNPVAEELAKMDLNNLTPLQALEFLAYLKGKII